MKIRVTFTVDIDPEAWADAYEVDRNRKEVSANVRTYLETECTDHLRELGLLAEDSVTYPEDFDRAVTRQLGVVGRRAQHSLEALTMLHGLHAQIDVMTYEAVASLRADGTNVPASWAEIGKALDITKQSAQERFAKAGGHRLRGGQPARYR